MPPIAKLTSNRLRSPATKTILFDDNCVGEHLVTERVRHPNYGAVRKAWRQHLSDPDNHQTVMTD